MILPVLGGAALAAVTTMCAAEWNLESLPSYAPQQKVGGVIRLGGSGLSSLVPAWEAAFVKYHPEVIFANHLPSSDVAMAAMILGTADIAASGREPDLVEVLGFTETHLRDVTAIVVASGAHTTKKGQGGSWSPVIFVSKDNPLTRLTMRQLDGIFGASRTGGYAENSAVFDPAAARGPERDIRTWGQLGLTGEWAGKPIQTYGYADTGMRHFFELRVFQGGGKWNPNYREYVETGTKMVPGGASVGSRDMLLAVSRDKYAIGWSGFGQAALVPEANLRAIALAPDDSGSYAEPTPENFQTKAYPLSRNVFLYVNRAPGQPLEPRIAEFLRFVLSREGQAIVASNGLRLPLTPAIANEQRRKID